VANLGVPDLVLYHMSDAVDHGRRMTRMADVSLMVDGEDGFGNAVNVGRTVKELEAAGVSAIEIEDNIAPVRFNAADPGLHATAEQVGKLEAAVAARTDDRIHDRLAVDAGVKEHPPFGVDEEITGHGDGHARAWLTVREKDVTVELSRAATESIDLHHG
jgi:2-methylisocitrate lyase-like PEP mutase family enzyme